MASKSREMAFIEALKRDWQRINPDDNDTAALISRQASTSFPKFADDPSGIFAKIVGLTVSREDREKAGNIHDELGQGNSVETTITVRDRPEEQTSLYLTIITNGRHLRR